MPVKSGQSTPKTLRRVSLATASIDQFDIGYPKLQQCLAKFVQGLWKIILKHGQSVVPGLHVIATSFEFLKIQGVVIAELYV